MMKFSYQFDSDKYDRTEYPLVEVTMSADSSLDSVFEQFKGFLQAAGYVIDGEIDIVPEEVFYKEETEEALDVEDNEPVSE